MSKKSHPPLVTVKWKDTYSMDDLWMSYDDDFDPETRYVYSTGFLVGESEEYVAIASTFDPDSGCYGNGIFILKCCIVSNTPSP